jgi:hypothetical protein
VFLALLPDPFVAQRHGVDKQGALAPSLDKIRLSPEQRGLVRLRLSRRVGAAVWKSSAKTSYTGLSTFWRGGEAGEMVLLGAESQPANR